ncbi:MAG: repressor LexA [Elusimicrobia bacterium RIFOXYB2_FULL_48_7]|nr:MAG: repressor LexA [Elusimicrobia bacterium RIFOXYB2_FULL_48_7]
MPSYKELADVLGYPSVNSIQQYIRALEKKKYIQIEEKRGLKNVGPIEKKEANQVNIPLLGRVACGAPLFAEENLEGYVSISKNLVKDKPKNFFFLRAHGNSMNDDGIDDNDLLLIESQSVANTGDRVLALIDDEVTVKIFKPQAECVALLPKSKDEKYKPIIVSKDFRMQGVVRKVIKLSN